MAEWTFDPTAHVYRKGKRALTHDELMAVRNAIADGMTEESASLAAQLVGKVFSLAEWAKAFARLIANGVTAGFLLGRGGKAQMDDAALETLGSLIADQHDYAKDFTKAIAAELENEEPQLGFVASRSSLYSGASVHAFDQGRAQDFQVDLPFYPADWGTVCGSNCFPFDTMVESVDLSGAYRRWFDGQVVTVQTAGGHKLTATPNHPVLTGRGWVAIGNLTQTDCLVSGQVGQGVAFGQPDINHRPAQIGQVFDAAGDVWSRQRVMGSVFDFHGDRSDSEVDVVLRGGQLPGEFNGSFIEQVREFVFPGPDGLREFESFTRRLARPLIEGLTAAANGIMRGGSQRAPLLCGHASHAQEIGFSSGPRSSASLLNSIDNGTTRQTHGGTNRKHAFASVESGGNVFRGDHRSTRRYATQFDAALAKTIADDGSVSVAGLRQAIDGLASEIAFHDVVDIQRHAYRGHVFNLQTGQGWYSANGLIVHNCRCEWQIVDTDTELTATWIVVGDERSCDDCIARGAQHGPDSPFVQKKGAA